VRRDYHGPTRRADTRCRRQRKKWADEALAYNGLVLAWRELTKLAVAERGKTPAKQSEML
jgi:hypothetical protein